MKCPICGYQDSKVIDSRPTEDGSIRRRRECLGCSHRFTTFETIESKPLFVPGKLLGGIIKACYKRPVSSEQMSAIIHSVEQSAANSFSEEIPSSEIGSIVMDELRKIDEVSYVRFASVYREFRDAETFMKELSKLGIETK